MIFFVVKIFVEVFSSWFNSDKRTAVYLHENHSNIAENFLFRAFAYGIFETAFTSIAYSLT
jgi:hypothetical protein